MQAAFAFICNTLELCRRKKRNSLTLTSSLPLTYIWSWPTLWPLWPTTLCIGFMLIKSLKSIIIPLWWVGWRIWGSENMTKQRRWGSYPAIISGLVCILFDRAEKWNINHTITLLGKKHYNSNLTDICMRGSCGWARNSTICQIMKATGFDWSALQGKFISLHSLLHLKENSQRGIS